MSESMKSLGDQSFHSNQQIIIMNPVFDESGSFEKIHLHSNAEYQSLAGDDERKIRETFSRSTSSLRNDRRAARIFRRIVRSIQLGTIDKSNLKKE